MSRSISRTRYYELKETSNGRLNWTQFDDSGLPSRIKEADVLKSFGRTTDKQKPAKGYWLINGSVKPVTITGAYAGFHNGDQWLKAKETKAGIPKSEVIWDETELPPSENDQINSLRAQLEAVKRESVEAISDLKDRLDEALGQIALLGALKEENDSLRVENEKLRSEIDTIAGELDIERSKITQSEPVVAEVESGAVASPPEDRTESNPVTDTEAAEEDRRITTVTTENPPGVTSETDTVRTETDGAKVVEKERGVAVSEPPAQMSWWDRQKGRIYGGHASILTRKVPTREVRRDENGEIIYDARGNPEYVEEDDVRKTAIFIGGVAVGAVVVWLLTRHGVNHDVITNNQTDTIIHNQNTLNSQEAQILSILDPNGPDHVGNILDPNGPDVPGNIFSTIIHKLNQNHHDLQRLLRHEHAEHHGRFREFFRGHGLSLRFHGAHLEHLHAPIGGHHDTPWAHAENLIERKVNHEIPDNDPRISRVTDWILRHSGIRWRGGGYNVDAHRLPVGRELVVPNL